MKLKNLPQILFLTALAQVLSVATVFMAPLPLMLLRRRLGKNALLFATIVGGVSFYAFVPVSILCAFFVSCILAEVFSECESLNLGYGTSVFVTVLVLTGLGVLAMSFGHQKFGFNPIEFFREQITMSLEQLKVTAEMKIEKEALLKQVPSALVMLLIFTVWLNSILVTKVEKILKWPPTELKHKFAKSEVKQWKLPEQFIWPALLVAGGNFLLTQPLWLKWTSTNIFNIVVMLYFFQGLAIIASYVDRKKISPLWKTLIYLLIFTQLFLAVAFVGFIDLWMDFRRKMKTDKSAVA